MDFWQVLRNLKRNRQPILLLVTLLVTTALPLDRFDRSLWRDEASSVWFAHLPPGTLLTGLCDPHPPGYYLLLKAWLAGGQSEVWLRLPSLLAAVLAVALTYRLGREGYGRRCAWLAALLLALHPLHSWYAAEARMYSLVQSLGLLLAWLGWRLLPERAGQTIQGRQAAIYWLAALIALGVDQAALLPFALLQLLWLARGRPQARRWVSLQVAVLLSAAVLWLKAGQLQALGHGYPPILVAVQASRLGFDLTPAGATRLLQFVLIGLVLTGLVLAGSWSRRPDRFQDRPLTRLLLVAGWLALLLLAALPRAFTIKRQLIVLLPYLALLAGYVLARLPRPAGELVAGVGLLVTLLALPGHQREPWRTVVADLVQRQSGQAAVIWVGEQSVPAFDYYWPYSKVEGGPAQWTPLFDQTLPQLPDLAPRAGHTLWIVTAENTYRRLITLLPADFHRHYQLLDSRHEVGIGLYRYQRRINPAPGWSNMLAPSRQDRWGLLLPSALDTCQPE